MGVLLVAGRNNYQRPCASSVDTNSIDGVSIADKAKAIALGKKIVEFHATNTVAAIRTAIAKKGRLGTQP